MASSSTGTVVDLTAGKSAIGIENEGTTGWMNVILTALAHSPPLVHYLLSGHLDELNAIMQPRPFADALLRQDQYLLEKHKEDVKAADSFAEALAKFLDTFWINQPDNKQVFPAEVLDKFYANVNHFRRGEPQDVSEAISWTFELLDESFKNKPSIIYDLFSGSQVAQMRCGSCQNITSRLDVFLYLQLSLPPPPTRQTTLKECLDLYCTPESIDDWNCSSCKKRTTVWKGFKLQTLPKVLVIRLNRIYFGELGLQKNNIDVKAPLKNLDLSAYLAGETAAGTFPSYQLYAVISQRRNNSDYANVKRKGKWFQCSDSRVASIDEGEVIGPDTLILFYYRDDMKPLFDV